MTCIPDFTKDLDHEIEHGRKLRQRDWLAGIALRCLMERETAWPSCGTNPAEVARQAKAYVDALIAELEDI